VARPIVALLLLGVATAARAAPVDGGQPLVGQAEFEAAVAREATGDYAGAAAALEALARRRPDDAFADDALYEAAALAEERLGDPERAARLYGELLARYPASRLVRRARARADFLARSLASGAEPLRVYQEILAAYPRRPPAESLARMERLLAEHPDFVLADRALYWLGATYASAGRRADAERALGQLEARFPSSEYTPRGKRLRGELLLGGGHPLAARALYRELAAHADPTVRAAGEEGLREVRRAIVRWTLFVVGMAYLALFFVVELVLLRRSSRRGAPTRPRLPTELVFYLPIAALFAVAAATEHRAIGLATGLIAAGGALLVWLTGARTTATLAAGPLSRGRRAGRAIAVGLAALALAYVAIQGTGLTDLVVETLRSGPER
jgi:tetratricopeptide (TPR) repeat protein